MSITVVERMVRPLELSDNEVRFYRSEGYLYLPGVINEADAAALREEVLGVMELAGVSIERLSRALNVGDKLRQVNEYFAGSLLDGFINSPNLLRIAARLMEGPSTLYLPFSAVKNGGGGGRFHFHQDNQYTRFENGLLGMNLWFALQPMMPENGCLQIVPRSHHRGTLAFIDPGQGDGHRTVKTQPEDFLPIRMRPGDAVAFSRLTLHGSGPNHTDEPRIGYSVQFHRDDALATWDHQPARPLKEHPRWSTAPVTQVRPVADRNLDGH